MNFASSLRIFVAAAATVCCLAGSAFGAVDMFLKIDGIDGESTDDAHRGWIEVEAFSHDVVAAATRTAGSGGGAGKASFSDLSITKVFDVATPRLIEACASGKRIPTATLRLVKSSGENNRQPYYEIKLTDVMVSSYSAAGSSGGDIPTESLSLNFTKIEWTYTYQDASGKLVQVKGGWDLAKGTKI